MFENFTDDQFAAWLAGFTDGEGYIGVEPTDRKNVSAVRIILANTVKDVIVAIKNRLNFGSIRSQKQRSHWKEKFTFCVSNLHDAEIFINIVYPYLTIKKEAADLAIARIAEARMKYLERLKRNEAIKIDAKNGEVRKMIAVKFGISPQSVSRICEGHKWSSVQMSEFAKLRRRDKSGLFVPI